MQLRLSLQPAQQSVGSPVTVTGCSPLSRRLTSRAAMAAATWLLSLACELHRWLTVVLSDTQAASMTNIPPCTCLHPPCRAACRPRPLSCSNRQRRLASARGRKRSIRLQRRRPRADERHHCSSQPQEQPTHPHSATDSSRSSSRLLFAPLCPSHCSILSPPPPPPPSLAPPRPPPRRGRRRRRRHLS